MAAVEGRANLTLARPLGGHATRIPDYYVRRNPKMVADVCEAIRVAYGIGQAIRLKASQLARVFPFG